MSKTTIEDDHAVKLVDEIADILVKRLAEIRKSLPGSDKLNGNVELMEDALKRVENVTFSTIDMRKLFERIYELRRTLTLK